LIFIRKPTPLDEALKITDEFFIKAKGRYPKEERELEAKIQKKVKMV
jgi:hypothetical protein